MKISHYAYFTKPLTQFWLNFVWELYAKSCAQKYQYCSTAAATLHDPQTIFIQLLKSV
jgi:hypothetical protein